MCNDHHGSSKCNLGAQEKLVSFFMEAKRNEQAVYQNAPLIPCITDPSPTGCVGTFFQKGCLNEVRYL